MRPVSPEAGERVPAKAGAEHKASTEAGDCVVRGIRASGEPVPKEGKYLNV
jgi:hypothetical protein